MKHEHGSALPLVLIVAVGGLTAVLLALEVGRLGIVHRRVAVAAELAAETGATRLAEDRVRQGVIELDLPTAAEAARAYLALSASDLDSVSITAVPTEICVTVSDTYSPTLLGFIGASATIISRTSCAVPATG